jgi:HAMP domain-containing protein
MKRWPLSTKLIVWSMLLVGVAVVSCAIGTGFYLKRAQTDMLDTQLKGEAKYFFTQWEDRGRLSQSERLARIKELIPYSASRRLIEIRDLGRRVLYRSFDIPHVTLPVATLGLRTIKVRRENYRLGTFQKDDLILSVAGEMREIENDAGSRALAVLGILPFMLVVTGFGGWWIARTALAPVSDVAEAAEQITAQRLDARLDEPPVDDEIGRLTRVLNEMFTRLNESFRQAASHGSFFELYAVAACERFSADASHEHLLPEEAHFSFLDPCFSLSSGTLAESDNKTGDGKSRLMLPPSFLATQNDDGRASLGSKTLSGVLRRKDRTTYLASLRPGVRFLSFTSSRSLVTVRQLRTVPIVPNLESK